MNVPIVCAGACIEAGDVIVADDDGVCVVRRAEAAEALLRSAEAAGQRGGQARSGWPPGELGLDLYDMRPALQAKGLKYV